MNATTNDRELAETMIILTGTRACDAAIHFATDCRDRGNEVLAALWERVVASIVALTRAADPVVAPAAAEPVDERAPSKIRIEHLAYDHVAGAPKVEGFAFES